MQQMAAAVAAAVLVFHVIESFPRIGAGLAQTWPKTCQFIAVSYLGSRMTRVPVTYRSLNPVGAALSLFCHSDIPEVAVVARYRFGQMRLRIAKLSEACLSMR
jgi:hypothetical protein